MPLFETGPHMFTGNKSSAVILAHDGSYLVPEGTFSFVFTAASVDGRRFLLSKDSGGYDNGGHVGIYIEDGRIVARFQDLTTTYAVETDVLITAGQAHHLAVTFGPEGLVVYVDGVAQASDAYTGGLLGNTEPVVIGANQWSSGDGVADKLRDAFDGTVSTVSLYDTALDAAAVLELSASALNDAPVAADDALSTTRNTVLVIDVAADLLANDSDADGDPLEVTGFSPPVNGSLLDNGDGTWSYTPDPGHVGGDSFTYTLSDGQGGASVGTVSLTVTDPDNVAPVAAGDGYVVDEDTVLGVAGPGVLGNDSDANGDPLSATLVSGPASGTLVFGPDGGFSYTPEPDFAGEDSFTYRIEDGRGGSDTATATITVNGINDAPEASDAAFEVSPAAPAGSVLGTVPATDADGDVLNYQITAGNAAGLFAITSTGDITLADPAGLDPVAMPSHQLTVLVSDGTESDTATVTIAVSDTSTPAPLLTAGPHMFTGNIDEAVVIAHDDDYERAEGALALTFTAANVDDTSYLMSKDSRGFDNGGHLGIFIDDGVLKVRFQDRESSFETAAPAVITPGQTYQVVVNFDPVDGVRLYVDGIEQGAIPTYAGGLIGNQEPLVLGANQWKSGNFVATNLEHPLDGKIQDLQVFTSPLSLTEIIALFGEVTQGDPAFDVPQTSGDLLATAIDGPLEISIADDLLINDTDPDGDDLSFVGISDPANGTLVDNGDGTLTYTPGAGFEGNDGFQYSVSDGTTTQTANVVISVAEIPEDPVQGGTSPDWQYISTANGDLPGPGTPELTAAQVLDVDQDGLMDFVIAGRKGGPAVTWYRQTADGTWETVVIDSEALRIEAGGTVYDVDGDGDLDIFMGGDSLSNEIWWWENPYPDFDPSAEWTRHVVKSGGGNQHHDMGFGDFDNDGVDEFVFWNQKGDPRGLYIAEIPDDPKTSGPWDAVQITGTRREGFASGDIDGDGITDIVTGGHWYKWNGGTDFTEIVIDPSFPQGQVALGDFNEDGVLEVILSSGDQDGPLLMYQQTGDPTVSANWTSTDLLGVITDEVHSLEVADINQDGHLDIFAAEMNLQGENEDAKTWVLFGDGAGSFTTTVVASGIGSHESTIADLDDDGDIDILGKGFEEAEVHIWYNTLNEITLGGWDRTVIDEDRPWRAIFETDGDIDGDGLTDIITGGWWYRNPGSIDGEWVRNSIGGTLNNMAAVYDFDGDGDLDILGTEGVGSSPNSNFVWAQNDGSGNFTVYDNVDAGTGAFLQGVTVAELTLGGPASVVLSWQNGTGGTQVLTVPDDPTIDTWTWSQLSSVSLGEGLDHGDIDGDGDNDLLLGFKWLRNDETEWTSFDLHLPPGEAEPDRVHLVDMDGDGDLDAVVGFGHEASFTTLAWYEQPEDETDIWIEHIISDTLIGNPQSVDVADLDADGDLDVVAGEHLPNDPDNLSLYVFENSDGTGDDWIQYQVFSGDEHHDGAQLADFDNDGDLDIYSIGWTHGRVSIYENLTNGFDGLWG
ncbi:MAG: tandem-95 repeat protein [Pseudomonadota bacterium]